MSLQYTIYNIVTSKQKKANTKNIIFPYKSMYRRRQYSRKRTYRKARSTRSRPTLARKVRKVISRMAEHKQSEYSQGNAPYAATVPIVAGANAAVALVNIAQGSDNSNRIGDQVTGYTIVRGMIRNTSSTAACIARVTIIQDTAQSNTISANVAPVQSNIFVNPTDLYSQELVKQRRYNIIHKRVYNLGPSVSGSGQIQFTFKIPKRILNWTAGTTAVTDMSKGLSYILMESEIATNLQYTVEALTLFTDI